MPDTVSEPTAAAYPPGAVSRFLAWVDRLPGHGWWVFPSIVLGLFVWAHAVLWAAGLRPVGSIDPTVAVGVAYGPFALAALAYNNRVAERAIVAFWPATGWPDAERPGWTYRFVTTPAGYGWASLAIGVVLAVGSYLGAPSTVLGPGDVNRVPVILAYLPMLLFGYTMLPAAGVHIGRQLHLVTRIHHEAQAVDPFDRVPLYAFSRLTAQTGLVFLVVATYSLTVNGSFQAGNILSLGSTGAALVIGVLCFFVPLWGMHGRLVDEKDALLRDVDRRVTRLGAEMYARIDAGQFDATKVVSDGLAGMVTLRDRINRLPTWPWPPQVFRGFLSALMLPVIVYLVSRIIAGRIGA